jgi:arsenate reductase (glutaredoxin)
MVPVNAVAVLASLLVLMLYFRRGIPVRYDMGLLKAPAEAIRDPATFRAGRVVLALLLAGFFALEPLGVPVSAVAAFCAFVLLMVAGRGPVIDTRKVLRNAPWQIVVFSLGMYLVVYGLRNAGLTVHIASLLDVFAQGGVFGHRRGEGSHGVRQRDRLRPRTEDHAHRQPGHAALAACAGPQGHGHRLGVLLQGRPRADPSRAVRDPGGAGTPTGLFAFMNDITIYHNPACGTSRNVLALIRNTGEQPTVIEYLRHPPDRATLARLIGAMGMPVRELLRRKGTPYDELGLDDPTWTDAQLLDFMLAHPLLINRPIVVTPLGTRLCRPSEAVLDLLPRPHLGAFTKEDGEAVIDAKGQRVRHP